MNYIFTWFNVSRVQCPSLKQYCILYRHNLLAMNRNIPSHFWKCSHKQWLVYHQTHSWLLQSRHLNRNTYINLWHFVSHLEISDGKWTLEVECVICDILLIKIHPKRIAQQTSDSNFDKKVFCLQETFLGKCSYQIFKH